jgi:hypothetical protein
MSIAKCRGALAPASQAAPSLLASLDSQIVRRQRVSPAAIAGDFLPPDLAAIDIGEVDDRRTISGEQAPATLFNSATYKQGPATTNLRVTRPRTAGDSWSLASEASRSRGHAHAAPRASTAHVGVRKPRKSTFAGAGSLNPWRYSRTQERGDGGPTLGNPGLRNKIAFCGLGRRDR